MSKDGSGTDCAGRKCGFGVCNDDLGCTDGANCFEAGLLNAEVSKFHDTALADATAKINSIISAIPPDSADRQLSFIQTKMGTMLAWVRHDIDVPSDAVTAASADNDVARELGLINPPKLGLPGGDC